MNRPEIAQAIWDAAVSDKPKHINIVESHILADAFLSLPVYWQVAMNQHRGIHDFLQTDEGRTYMILVAEALS